MVHECDGEMHGTEVTSRCNCSLIALACLVASFLSATTAAASAVEVFRVASPSVVTVTATARNERLQGSGVIVLREGSSAWVATNCHVVRRASTVNLEYGNRTFDAKLLTLDEELDLCLLTSEDVPGQPATIRSEPVITGEAVYAIGSPRGLNLSLSNGIVSQLRQHASTYALIQITAPVSPGSSGGGLFDGEGRLVGITTSSLARSQNINFAIPAAAINDAIFANVWAVTISLLADSPAQGLAPALDQAVPGWRRDLTSTSFLRWLGLARDRRGGRRHAGIGPLSTLALPPSSWHSVIEVFQDYRASPFFKHERSAATAPAPPRGTVHWHELGGGADYKLFGDPARVGRSESKLIAWSLIDYTQQQQLGTRKFRSVVRAHEIECAGSKIATRQATYFVGPMGQGGVVGVDDTPGRTSAFANPGSLLESFITWACRQAFERS